MLNSIKNKTVLLKLFISYFVIFVIPLMIMTAILYKTNVIDLRKEIISSNGHKLAQLMDNTDSRMKVMEATALKMSLDYRISHYKMVDSIKGQIEGIEQLGIYKAPISFADQLILYYKNEENIFSNIGLYSMDIFTRNIYGFSNEDSLKFREEIKNAVMPYIRPPDNVDLSSSKNIGLYTYMYPISYINGKPSAIVLFLIKKQEFAKMMQDFLGEQQGSVFIIDKMGTIISAYSEDTVNNSEFADMINGLDAPGIYSKTFDREKYSFIKVDSDYTGWSFVVAIKDSQIYKQAVYMQALIMQIALALLAFGIFVIIMFARTNYRPIGNLIRYITLQWPQEVKTAGMNEIEQISSTVMTALSQNKDLKAQVDLQLPMVEDQVLTTLLKGEIKDEKSLLHMLAQLKIKFDGPYYTVMVLGKDSCNDDEMAAIRKGDVISIIRQKFSKEGIAYPIELLHENAIVLVVNIDAAVHGRGNHVEIASRIQLAIENQTGLKFAIGIGKVCKSIMQINRSFVEALAAIESRMVKGGGQVFCFDDISKNQKHLYWYPTEDQLRFIQSLKQGNKTIALEALKDMMSSISEKGASTSMVKCVCFDIVNMVIKTINDMDTVELDIDNVIQFSTLHELEKQLGTLTVKICRFVESKKEKKNLDLYERIMEYVNENYNSVELSLEIISGKFNLSLCSISKIFKEFSGSYFSDYITELRIKKIKELLVNTDDTLNDIMLNVGYTNLPSFIRKFKKIEGITPGEFRKMHTKTNQ